MNMGLALMIVAGVYGVVSLVTLVAYGLDKRAARLGRRRTPERTLHRMAWLGGWPGALAAMQLFAHKRRKKPFVVKVLLIASVHVAIWVAVATQV
ncbi:MAG: uncharacterized membrane protein YsdA (DUF1294 family) [Myxococcota bacterium]|jgi:uncharacterized membrane protein YsdA (DUF1294 family)